MKGSHLRGGHGVNCLESHAITPQGPLPVGGSRSAAQGPGGNPGVLGLFSAPLEQVIWQEKLVQPTSKGSRAFSESLYSPAACHPSST